MDEYMSKEDYCEINCGKENREGYKTCKNCGMLNVPTSDVQPVKYGEWRRKFLSDTICCSECKVTWSSSFKNMLNGFNYCPNCGARMDGDKND